MAQIIPRQINHQRAPRGYVIVSDGEVGCMYMSPAEFLAIANAEQAIETTKASWPGTFPQVFSQNTATGRDLHVEISRDGKVPNGTWVNTQSGEMRQVYSMEHAGLKFPEYAILKDKDPYDLMNQVNNAIREGWKVSGGLTMCDREYCQAMIKE